MEPIQHRLYLETFEPHARCLQTDITAAIPPSEIIVAGTTDSVDAAVDTALVPESASVVRSAVGAPVPVVITVIRTEHHPVAVTERIKTGVATVPRHTKPVVGRLIFHSERAVLCPVPTISTSLLQLKPQLVPALLRQLTQSFIANPEVAAGDAEPNYKLRP